VVVVPLRADILDNDLTFVYIGIRIGLEHGWSHIYSLSLQHQLFTDLRPHAVFNDDEWFVSPPPFAWLVLPLSLFGAAGAVYAWLLISVLALGASWWIAAPGERPRRGLWLLAALAWYPVMYGLRLAQPDLLILFFVAVAWRLAEKEKPYLAGAVLGLAAIKPQLTLFLPLVLLAAGRWRIAVSWAVTAGLLAAASVAMLGGQGLADYVSLLNEARNITNNRYFTLAFVLGPGALASVAQGMIAVAALVGAYLNRNSSHARVFALGLVATSFGATYWHLQDFTILLLAAWLFWHSPSGASRHLPTSGEDLPAWQRWWLLAVALTAEFAWPLTPLPVLITVAVWFFCLAVRRQASPVAA
jgi:hypothetical protein